MHGSLQFFVYLLQTETKGSEIEKHFFFTTECEETIINEKYLICELVDEDKIYIYLILSLYNAVVYLIKHTYMVISRSVHECWIYVTWVQRDL